MSNASQHPGVIRARLEFPVWYRGFTRSYVAWANAPADLKAPLLLQGQPLAKAEGWLLACPDRLSESQKRFIVRSITQRSREPVEPVAEGPARPRTPARGSRWRRSSDRSLWHLLGVIVLGLWVFSPDIIRSAMERALNPPEVYRELGKSPQVAQGPVQTPQPVADDDAQSSDDSAPVVPPGSAADASAADADPLAAVKPTPARPGLEDAEEMPRAPAATPPTPAPPPLSRAARLAELARERLAAGQQRTALLLGMEAVEAALAVDAPGTADTKAAASAAGLLARALAKREALGPLAPRAATAPTTLFCRDAQAVLAIAADETLAHWPVGSIRRASSHRLALPTLEGAGVDRECRRVLLPDEDFNVVIRQLTGDRTSLRLVGHEATILAAAFGPDARTVITASQDGTARIWDGQSGRQRALLSGHDWHVLAAELSPDGRRALTASSDLTARVWDAATGRELGVLRHQGVVTSARYVAEGRRILSTSWDGTVRLWDGATGAPLHVLGHAVPLALAEASRDGRRIATADTDGGLQLWDGETGAQVRTTPPAGEPDTVRMMRLTPDGSRLAVLRWSGRLALHDTDSGEASAVLSSPDQKVRAIELGAGGRSLTAIADDGTRHIWPLAASPADALAAAKAVAPECLSADERASLGVDGGPPGWCGEPRARGAALPQDGGER